MDNGMVLFGIVAIVALVVITAIVHGRHLNATGSVSPKGARGTVTTTPADRKHSRK